MVSKSKQEEDVLGRFSRRGLTQGGEVYLDAEAVRDLIVDVEQSNLLIVGIEGFLLSDGKLQPRLDLIADFSDASAATWNEVRKICNNAAMRWVDNLEKSENLVLTVTLLSECEWDR